MTGAEFEPQVLVVGSGVSSVIDAAQAGQRALPNGAILSSTLCKLVLGGLPEHATEAAPFEQVLEYHPDQARLRQLIAEAYSAEFCTPVHCAVVRRLTRGLQAVITTNYDLGLETAAAQLGMSDQLTPVVRENDPVTERGVLFKAHGCAVLPDTLVATLTGEAKLPPWKRSLLARLIRDKDVLFIGYSGRDFDICPFLLGPEVRPRTVRWLVRGTDEVSPYAAKAMTHWPNVKLIGSFETVFTDLTALKPLPRAEAETLAGNWYQALTPEQQTIWRVRLGHALALDVPVSRQLSGADWRSLPESERLKLEADLGERTGRYLAAARLHRQEAQAHQRSGHERDAERARLEAVTCLYTGGHVVRGLVRLAGEIIRWRVWRRDAHARIDFANSGLLYARALFIKGMLEFSPSGLESLLPDMVHRRLRDWLAGEFAYAADAAYSRGEWQACFLAMAQKERLGAPGLPRGDALVPALEGFRQLGASVSRRIVERNSVSRTGYWPSPSQLLEDIDVLDELGIYPEMWKWFLAVPADHWLACGRAAVLPRLRRTIAHLKASELSSVLFKMRYLRTLRRLEERLK